MEFTLNGKVVMVDPHPGDLAISIIREKFNLTGAKAACNEGACGACTILLDGIPVNGCLLPAQRLANRTVTTIEKYKGDSLHPVQKAFMEADALQCGFCTPGFVLSAIAFVDNWKEKNALALPDHPTIAAALSGHLCRCGAYKGIYEAIENACKDTLVNQKTSAPRVDAYEKVTGAAKFTVDIQLPNQLKAFIYRSPHAHAQITAIDLTALKKAPSVKAVWPIAKKDVTLRYIGQEIVAIAVDDEKVVPEIWEKLNITYKILPKQIHFEANGKQAKEQFYKENTKEETLPNTSEIPIAPGKFIGNLRQPLFNFPSLQKWRSQRIINSAKNQAKGKRIVVEDTWSTPNQCHTPLEPHACVAFWNTNGFLKVYLSTQSCDLMSRKIADHFNLHSERVQVIAHYVGGGFGSKIDLSIETIAAIQLSKITNQPIFLALSRAEEFLVGGYRSATHINLQLVSSLKGKLKALSAKALNNTGIGINGFSAALMRLVYPKALKELKDVDILSNIAPAKPFRAPGGPPAAWALEQAIDRIAFQTNQDPIKLRMKWDPHRLRKQLYQYAAQLPIWENRFKTGSQSGRFRKGVGIAMGSWFNFYQPTAEVLLTASKAGIKIECATQDVGNGIRSVLANIVADTFGLSAHDIQVIIGESGTARGPSASSSRSTNSLYAPTKAAAEAIRKQMLAVAKTKFTLKKAKITATGIKHTDGLLPWRDVLKHIPVLRAQRKRGTDYWIDPLTYLAVGVDNLTFGRGFTSSLLIAEVQVDTLLGKIKPIKFWCGLACGKIVAPELAKSQCYSGIIQGIGYALHEEWNIDPETGQLLGLNFGNYKLPKLGDTPEIEIYFLEKGFRATKGRASGLAEVVTIPVAAAIGNAVFNATGWCPTSLPIQPKHILNEFAAPVKTEVSSKDEKVPSPTTEPA